MKVLSFNTRTTASSTESGGGVYRKHMRCRQAVGLHAGVLGFCAFRPQVTANAPVDATASSSAQVASRF